MFLYLPKLLIRHLEDFLLGPKCNKLLCLQAHTLLCSVNTGSSSKVAFPVNYGLATGTARMWPQRGRGLRCPGWLRTLAPGWVLAWSQGRGKKRRQMGG